MMSSHKKQQTARKKGVSQDQTESLAEAKERPQPESELCKIAGEGKASCDMK